MTATRRHADAARFAGIPSALPVNSRMRHIAISMPNMREWSDLQLNGAVRDPETGKLMTPPQVRAWLDEQIQAGNRWMPIGSPCEGFSYVSGCLGHDIEVSK